MMLNDIPRKYFISNGFHRFRFLLKSVRKREEEESATFKQKGNMKTAAARFEDGFVFFIIILQLCMFHLLQCLDFVRTCLASVNIRRLSNRAMLLSTIYRQNFFVELYIFII